MTHVMEMSTDQDILATRLHQQWNPIAARFSWAQVSTMGLGIPNNAIIVVIAHGSGEEIGNEQPGTVDINAEMFIALVQSNMANHAMPQAVYISTCGPGIAQFAARVRQVAEHNQVWAHTRIYGHNDPVAGDVPPPNDMRWTQIF